MHDEWISLNTTHVWCVLTGVTGKTCVIAGIRRNRSRYHQSAGSCLPLRQHVNAAPLRVINQIAILVPVDERRRMAGLQRHACQVDVAAALEEQFAVGEDFRFCDYRTGGNGAEKYKRILGEISYTLSVYYLLIYIFIGYYIQRMDWTLQIISLAFGHIY